jgi:creatinine amidohydrolase/Fe(II)-dependent formamide hydrolase-like protein
LKAVAKDLHRQKFEAICFVSIHGPNILPVGTAVRELFEFDGITTGLFNPCSLAEERLKESGEDGLDGAALETMMCHAAMEFLGLTEYIPNVEETLTEPAEQLYELPKHMMVGYHYHHIDQHQPVRRSDCAKGKELLKQTASELAENVKTLRKYIAFIENK